MTSFPFNKLHSGLQITFIIPASSQAHSQSYVQLLCYLANLYNEYWNTGMSNLRLQQGGKMLHIL